MMTLSFSPSAVLRATLMVLYAVAFALLFSTSLGGLADQIVPAPELPRFPLTPEECSAAGGQWSEAQFSCLGQLTTEQAHTAATQRYERVTRLTRMIGAVAAVGLSTTIYQRAGALALGLGLAGGVSLAGKTLSVSTLLLLPEPVATDRQLFVVEVILLLVLAWVGTRFSKPTSPAAS